MTGICNNLTIGLVTTEYVTEDNFDGGLSNYTYRVALSLKQIGHTPIIFLITNKPTQVIIHQGIEVHRIKIRGWKLIRLINLLTLNKCSSALFQLYRSLCTLFYIKRMHKSTCLSILHYPSCAGLGLFRPKNLPCIIRISSYIPLWNKAYEMERTVNLRLSEKIEDIAYLKADALLAPSYLNARAVENAIGRPVTVIETPFIMETVELDDSVYRLYLQHKKYLLFFGTIGLMKGCGLIAEIIYELLDQELDLYFAFVGKDTGYLGYKGESIMDRIRKNAKQHVERIIHIDRLPHKYLYPIISHSYAVVLPSRVDNMPNACLEAMGHRKIVIGTDGASFEQLIVDGVSGFLCKIDDKRSLLEKIQKVLFVTKKSECLYQNQINQVSSNNCKSSRLRILTYPWHIPHQYELYKLGYHFTLIVDAGSWHTTGWNFDLRPIPPNIEFKSIRDINVRDYDLAILHFDENVLSPQNCYPQVDLDWGKTFKYFREKIDLPKIAICHGTPQFYGQCNLNYKGSNLLEIIELERLRLVDYLDSILVITNSYQAQAEWQLKNSQVIWHGFDPDASPLTTYAKGILSPYGQAVISRPHYRGYHVYHDVIKRLPPDRRPSTLSVKIPDKYTSPNHYAQLKFQNYVNNIREYSIYFNPTVRSPMPRSRGEAMMCGLVTVSLRNHDVDKFIENGVNGFYADTAKELAEILCYLVEHPEETQNIGLKSRELAIKTFHIDRFLNDWKTIIGKTLGISIDDL